MPGVRDREEGHTGRYGKRTNAQVCTRFLTQMIDRPQLVVAQPDHLVEEEARAGDGGVRSVRLRHCPCPCRQR